MIDKENCGHCPRPETWHERDDDGSWGLEVCSLMDKYSCKGCKWYMK